MDFLGPNHFAQLDQAKVSNFEVLVGVGLGFGLCQTGRLDQEHPFRQDSGTGKEIE